MLILLTLSLCRASATIRCRCHCHWHQINGENMLYAFTVLILLNYIRKSYTASLVCFSFGFIRFVATENAAYYIRHSMTWANDESATIAEEQNGRNEKKNMESPQREICGDFFFYDLNFHQTTH